MPVWSPPGAGVAELPNAGTYVLAPPVAATDNRAFLETQVAATPANATIVFPSMYEIATPWRYKSGGRRYVGLRGMAEEGGAGLALLNGSNPAGATTALAVPEEWDANTISGGGPVTFENLYFDGNAANNTGTYSCLLMFNYWYRIRDGCNFNGPRLHHVLLAATTKGGSASSITHADGWIYKNRFRNGLAGTDGAGVRQLGGSAGKNPDVRCLSNHFENMQHGIVGDDCPGWTIFDNHIWARRNGINIDGGWFALGVNENYIDSFGEENAAGPFYGIRVRGFGVGRLPTVNGNRISGPDPLPGSATGRYWLRIEGGNDNASVEVIGNTAKGPFNTPSANAYGFSFVSSTGTLYLTELGNTPQAFNAGKDKEYSGTISYKAPRWMTGTATWNPGSVGNGAISTVAVTVPGASVGDTVQVGWTPALAALTSWRVDWAVTAADTVTVAFENRSGGSITPASTTVRATATKFNG